MSWDQSPFGNLLNAQGNHMQNQLSSYLQSPFAQTFGDYQQVAVAPSDGKYELARAAVWAKDGDEILDRIAFWSAFGIFGWPMLNSLARRLDRVTDQIEAYVESANRKAMAA